MYVCIYRPTTVGEEIHDKKMYQVANFNTTALITTKAAAKSALK